MPTEEESLRRRCADSTVSRPPKPAAPTETTTTPPMGRITTNIGLITGFPIQDTVDQLVALQARPIELLAERNTTLSAQQTALTELTAQLVSLQLNTDRLSLPGLYSQRSVSSSNTSVISVNAGDDPPLGSYQFKSIRQVQSQQLLSSKLASDTDPLGAGSLTFQYGGEVDRGISLDLLNSGNGIDRGTIRITDRSGATADIDLSLARNVDDVLDAINDAGGISVTASTRGDQFRLTDTSGGSGSLKVEEVNDGTTAATLGLAGIDTTSTVADGDDVLSLFSDIDVSFLNDGLGVGFDELLADLQFSFRDGTTLDVDFRKLATSGTRATGTTDSSNGINANVTVTADTEGSSQDGVIVAYQNDATITKGNESATFDADLNLLIVKIDEGSTTAADVAAAINGDEEVSALFTASLASGSSGDSPVDAGDTTVLRGPQSTATTPGTLDPNAAIEFTAVTGGPEFDGYAISFVHNAGIAAGNEQVSVTNSPTEIVIEINEATSTAADVVAAVNAHPIASARFTAELASGSDGTGLIDVANDGVTTSGGAYIEPVAGGSETTLADVLATLNAADPAKLQASLSGDGQRIVLTDLTTDLGGSFTVTSLNDSRAAEDLGLTTTASGDTLTGGRIFSALNTTLLSTLGGGQGLDLGTISITDRSGSANFFDLSSAETLNDVVATLNLATIGIEARINDTRDGILISDTTGSTANNLVVANGSDGLLTADKLGITVDAAVSSIDGGSLDRQTVSKNTRLSSLNGGSGVSTGSFTITDTLGATQTINVTSSIETIGDLILEIDRSGLQVEARINDTGDGILLVDTAAGTETLKVEETSGDVARDLHILGESTTVDISGTPTQVIDGSTKHTVTLDADDSLQDLRDKINELGTGITATIINDGSSVKPYRLNIVSDNAGEAGAVRFNASGLGITFEETVAAQDALLRFGDEINAGGGILVASSSNTFDSVVDGLSVTLNETSSEPVTVLVESTDTDLVAQVIAIVDTYNSIRERIDILTAFDVDSNTRGTLQGDSAVLRLESDLANLVTDRIFGAGSIQSLAELGVSVDQDGTLSFDQSELESKFAEDPAAVEQFFSTAGVGLSDRFNLVIDQLAGVQDSVLVNRTVALGETIASNEARILRLNDRLDATRELLLTQFINAELIIGELQSSLSAIESITALEPLRINSLSRNR
ncbi:MAG: hypothetical protein DWQ42_08080 [Planctomycetota bacterium]|nr:MAG: hypothetical protein DWQ42_08080 [Planctomycetota bacterium]REK47266.1 MAG: hypothetical protein DWQ46_04530 [Planctomycetota bacterium]